MIFADKIMALRKKNGWSQEELAEKLGVTRQSVSKWEGAQSIPDLDKILRLAELFGVSTDYLLKEEMEEVEYAEETKPEGDVRRVSMEEANAFLSVKEYTAKRIALTTGWCILAPTPLILLTVASETGAIGLSDTKAGGLGLLILLLMVIPAVAVFIFCGSKTDPYQYLEKEVFETEYGVTGMVRERQKKYRQTHTRYNILGASFCILAVVAVCMPAFVTENGLAISAGVCGALALAAMGVVFFIIAGINWESMQKLLQEGDYAKGRKKKSSVLEALGTVYWMVTVAIYLAYSFATNDWGRSWIVWPVAGVLYVAVMTVFDIFYKKRED